MELRTLRASDLEQAWELDSDAFHVPEERRDLFLCWTDPDCFTGIFDGTRLVALTRTLPLGQFFGGRSVPMGGLSGVSVAPDARGRGLARRLVTAVLEGMREGGHMISTLFPASTRLYRELGWEVAGNHLWRSLAPRSLAGLDAPGGGRVRPGGEGDLPAIRSCYTRVARGTNGFVDRPERYWRRLVASWEERSVFVAEDDAGGVTGYLVYRQIDGEHSEIGGSFRLAVDDLVADTRDAALGLWRLLGSWSAQVEQIVYLGPAEDPLLLLLPEQDATVLAGVRWMTRMVDVVGAVETRGFAPGVDVEVPLTLRDPLLSANEGRFVLRVGKGRGQLERGGPGGPGLAVGAFSSLYTGWASTALLARSGLIDGGSEAERAALDTAFAGPSPWTLELF